MIAFTNSTALELRGIAPKTTKEGKTYHMINTEAEDGTPFAIYCKDVAILPQGLRKGDKLRCTFEYYRYGNNERLILSKVEKING